MALGFSCATGDHKHTFRSDSDHGSKPLEREVANAMPGAMLMLGGFYTFRLRPIFIKKKLQKESKKMSHLQATNSHQHCSSPREEVIGRLYSGRSRQWVVGGGRDSPQLLLKLAMAAPHPGPNKSDSRISPRCWHFL